jgi:hypothetical protein
VKLEVLPFVQKHADSFSDGRGSPKVFPVKSLVLFTDPRQQIVPAEQHLDIAVTFEDSSSELIRTVLSTVNPWLNFNFS